MVGRWFICFWGPAYFQGRTVRFREGNSSLKNQCNQVAQLRLFSATFSTTFFWLLQELKSLKDQHIRHSLRQGGEKHMAYLKHGNSNPVTLVQSICSVPIFPVYQTQTLRIIPNTKSAILATSVVSIAAIHGWYWTAKTIAFCRLRWLLFAHQ